MRARAIASVIMLVLASSLHAQGSDWTKFLGPLGTSVSTEKGILAPWPDKGLRLVWQRPLGSGYGAAAVSEGKLFICDRVEDQSRLACVDARTGAFHWDFKYTTDYKDYFGYNNGPRSCPVVDADRVYFHGAEGVIHCVSAKDGKMIWKVDTREDFNLIKNFFGVGAAPVIEGDLLIAQVGGSPKGFKLRNLGDFPDIKGDKSAVVAFNKLTGKVTYRISDELAGYSSPVLATIDGRRWCFVLARGGLLGFNPADGKIDFHFPWRSEDLESVNASNPVVVGNHVFITECYGPGGALLKVRPGGYDVVWDDAKKFRKSLACHWMTPIHHDGYLYGSSGRHTNNAELRCIELKTAKVMWTEPRLTRTSLLMVDNHFICLGEDGMLRLLKVNPNKYEEISATEVIDAKTKKALLDYPCWAAPVLSHGLLYARGEERLVCLELIPKK